MPTDSVLNEVRANREAYAARFGFDTVAMALDLREKELARGTELIEAPPCPNRTDVEPKIDELSR